MHANSLLVAFLKKEKKVVSNYAKFVLKNPSMFYVPLLEQHAQ